MKAVRINKSFEQLRRRGQGLMEYALILALIAIVVILILTFMGDLVFVRYYSRIGSSMDSIVR